MGQMQPPHNTKRKNSKGYKVGDLLLVSLKYKDRVIESVGVIKDIKVSDTSKDKFFYVDWADNNFFASDLPYSLYQIKKMRDAYLKATEI